MKKIKNFFHIHMIECQQSSSSSLPIFTHHSHDRHIRYFFSIYFSLDNHHHHYHHLFKKWNSDFFLFLFLLLISIYIAVFFIQKKNLESWNENGLMNEKSNKRERDGEKPFAFLWVTFFFSLVICNKFFLLQFLLLREK